MNAKKNDLRAEKMSNVASKWQSLSNSDHVMCRMRLKTYERPSLQYGPRRRKKSKLKKEKISFARGLCFVLSYFT